MSGTVRPDPESIIRAFQLTSVSRGFSNKLYLCKTHNGSLTAATRQEIANSQLKEERLTRLSFAEIAKIGKETLSKLPTLPAEKRPRGYYVLTKTVAEVANDRAEKGKYWRYFLMIISGIFLVTIKFSINLWNQQKKLEIEAAQYKAEAAKYKKKLESAAIEAINNEARSVITKRQGEIDKIIHPFDVIVSQREAIIEGYLENFRKQIAELIQIGNIEDPNTDQTIENEVAANEKEIEEHLSKLFDKPIEDLKDSIKRPVRKLVKRIRPDLERVVKSAKAAFSESDPRIKTTLEELRRKCRINSVESTVSDILRTRLDLDVHQRLKSVINQFVLASRKDIQEFARSSLDWRAKDLADFSKDGLGYFMRTAFIGIPEERRKEESFEEIPVDKETSVPIPHTAMKDLRRGLYGRINVRLGDGRVITLDGNVPAGRDPQNIARFCDQLRKEVGEKQMQKILFLHSQGVWKNATSGFFEKGFLADQAQAVGFVNTTDIFLDDEGNMRSESKICFKVSDPTVDKDAFNYFVAKQSITIPKQLLDKEFNEELTEDEMKHCSARFTFSDLYFSVEEANKAG